MHKARKRKYNMRMHLLVISPLTYWNRFTSSVSSEGGECRFAFCGINLILIDIHVPSDERTIAMALHPYSDITLRHEP